MVNNYKLLLAIEDNPIFLFLLKKGIVPISILNRKVYYERFLQERKKHSIILSVANTAEEFNCSERTIYAAIKFMKN